MIHEDKSSLNIFSNRVYEKIMEKMKEIGQTVTGLKRKVANWAKGVALQGNMNLENGYVHILCMTSISKLWQHICLGSLIIIYMYLPLRYFKEGFPLVVTKCYTLSDLKDWQFFSFTLICVVGIWIAILAVCACNIDIYVNSI